MLKKILSVLLCCVLAVGVFAGCSKDKEETNKSETATSEGTTVANYEVEYFDGKEDGVVATVAGEEITVDEYNYFLLMGMYTEAMNAGEEGAKEGFWTDDKIDAVLESAMNQAVLTHVYRIAGEKEGVKISDEEIESIEANISSGIGYYGSEENLNMYFESQALTRELFKEISIRSYYGSELYNKYIEKNVSDEEVEETFNKDYVKAKHILIQKTNEEGTDISAEAFSRAEDIKVQIDGGADFDALMNEYNEDPGMASNPDGYVFTKGEMVAEFEEAAFALEPGQVSDIVETDYGYHIIRKEKLTTESLDEETMDMYGYATTLRDTIRASLGGASFNDYLENEKSKLTVKINNKEYNKFTKDTEKRFTDFVAKSDELNAKLNEIMAAASEVPEESAEE